MTLKRLALPGAFALALTLAVTLTATPLTALAQSSTQNKAHPKSSKAPSKKAVPAKAVQYVPAEPASPEQIDASERVFYGVYECEFKQTIDITPNAAYPAFVDLKHGKITYLMKPVLSSTGAIRLEDIRGQTLMVQIASKSMLLHVKTAQRLVDDCVSPRQRDLIDAARAAKAAALAQAQAQTAASAPEAGASAPALQPEEPKPLLSR